MTFNVHLLTHLCRSVREWGPIWATSVFAFEDKNRFVLSQKKSPYQVAKQIANRYICKQILEQVNVSIYKKR